MSIRNSMFVTTSLALLASGSAMAQVPAAPAGATMPTVQQTTENPMVPVGDATHIAHLGRAATEEAMATAWLRLDPQNNTLDWTIEYDGAGEITAASLLCPAPGAAAPAAEGNGMGIDTEGMVEAVNITANSENPNSPLEGVAADLTQATFMALESSSCVLSITTSTDGDAGPITGRIDRLTDAAAGGVAAATPGPAPATPTPEPAAAPGPAGAEDVPQATLMAEGAPLYARNCAVCHGDEGQGGAGERLVNSPIVAFVGGTVNQILLGAPAHGMPPFARLSDREIAAIATYIRNSWGNAHGPVAPGDVAAARGGAGG